MRVLGITGGVFGEHVHDPGVCLMEDGKILTMVAEERIWRVKHSYGKFPLKAIEYVLQRNGLKMSDIDKVCLSFKPDIVRKYIIRNVYNPVRMAGLYRYYNGLKITPSHYLKKHFDYNGKIEFYEHHLCHAASAFYCSGFKKAMIMTIDGLGEQTATMLGIGTGSNIEKIKEIRHPHSLGRTYAIFTELLGYAPLDGEGTVMGLAPYGNKYLPVFDEIISDVKDGEYKISTKYIGYGAYDRKLPFKQRISGEPLNDMHKNIAYSLQKRLEHTELSMLKWLADHTDTRNLCIAGGVGLNCKANGVLLESGLIDDIFVQPASADDGSALGAALLAFGKPIGRMEHAYYGPDYDDNAIENQLKISKIKYEYREDIAKVAGEMVAKNKIVGWYQGKMEWGPRALGNRTILANPGEPGVKDRINFYVKHREPFRPFCPSMLNEEREKYGVKHELPFMIVGTMVPEERVKEISGVVHVDNSIRAQTVTRKANPKYHELISTFYKNTGVPVVLNTSYNVKGQPIVNTPKDALAMLFSEGMDAACLGNYLVTKA